MCCEFKLIEACVRYVAIKPICISIDTDFLVSVGMLSEFSTL